MASNPTQTEKERMAEILEELKEGPKRFREMFGREQTGTDSRAIKHLKIQNKISRTPEGFVRTDLEDYCPDCGTGIEKGQRRCQNPNCSQPVRALWCGRCGDLFPIPPVPPHSGRFECRRCGNVERVTLPEYDLLEGNEQCRKRGCRGDLRLTTEGLECQACGGTTRPFERTQRVICECPHCEETLRIRGDIVCPECGVKFEFKPFNLEIHWVGQDEPYQIDGRMICSKYHESVEAKIEETLHPGLQAYANLDLRVHPPLPLDARI